MPSRLQRAAIVSALACAGCSVTDLFETAKEGERLTIKLFAAIDDQDFPAIRELFAADLAEAYQLDSTAAVFGLLHEQVGTCDTPRMTNWDGKSTSAGTYCNLSIRVGCDEGVVFGALVWKLEGGSPKLASFNFSKQLATSAPFKPGR